MKRLLITGSRTWTNTLVIEGFLKYAVNYFTEPVTLVSGACPKGADLLCEQWWERNTDYPIERHPAKWQLLGKKAGFVRNAKMVELGADLCIAFIKDGSKGATMTANLARDNGISVIEVNEISQ